MANRVPLKNLSQLTIPTSGGLTTILKSTVAITRRLEGIPLTKEIEYSYQIPKTQSMCPIVRSLQKRVTPQNHQNKPLSLLNPLLTKLQTKCPVNMSKKIVQTFQLTAKGNIQGKICSKIKNKGQQHTTPIVQV